MISFNNIPETKRTPGVILEVDNSRAVRGLVQNPHRVLILGAKETAGSASAGVLKQITYDNLADGYFGAGSLLSRMCKTFRKNNRYTEMWAMALPEDGASVRASGVLSFGGSVVTAGTLYMQIGGQKVYTPLTLAWSAQDMASAVKSDINGNSTLCMTASAKGTTGLYLLAVGSGEYGNHFDVRINYYEGQNVPSGVTYILSGLANGSTNPDITDAWAVIDGLHFHHIINPFTDATNLTELKTELTTRFGPLDDLQGHAYTAVKGTFASVAAIGLSHNNPHLTIIGEYQSPTNPEEWAAAWGAVAAYYLNIDPARPLHFLSLNGVLPPQDSDSFRFSNDERNLLLYDGIATWIVDADGKVKIERSITTYRTNALGLADPSYLDIETLFTLLEIRFQYKVRMTNRYIIPRFKLADDTTPVPAGAKVARPVDIRQEVIALFTDLQEKGLIENIDDFIENLVVERNLSDRNRVDVLVAPDLINQFRILAGQIQFIL